MLVIETYYSSLSPFFVTMVGRQAGRQVGRWVEFTYHDLKLLLFLTKGIILDAARVLALPKPKGKKSRAEHILLVVILKCNIKSK